jgi:hypothetical protein
LELHPELVRYASNITLKSGSSTLLDLDATCHSFYKDNLLSSFEPIGIRHGILMMTPLVIEIAVQCKPQFHFKDTFSDVQMITHDDDNNSHDSQKATLKTPRKKSLMKRPSLDTFVHKIQQCSDIFCVLHYYKTDQGWQNDPISDIHYIVSSKHANNTVAYLQTRKQPTRDQSPIANDLIYNEFENLLKDKHSEWRFTFTKQPLCINKFRFIYHNGICSIHEIDRE